MYKISYYFSVFLFFFVSVLSARSIENEKLITIHGILGSRWNMYYLGIPLEKEKMDITYWEYPSRDKTIVDHGKDLVVLLKKEAAANPGKPIHFLTHSMGGLVLRAALNQPDCPPEARIGKAVLLAPPNQGAAWARILKQFKVIIYLAKNYAGKELTDQENFEHLGQFPETMDVLVIAGDLSINLFIDGPNDGTVGVAETYLSTPHRHIVIHQEHKSILLSKEAANLTKKFFKEAL